MIRVLSQVNFPSLNVDPQRVWCLLGYTDSNKASPTIQGVFHRAMEIGANLLEPAACYDILKIKRVNSSSIEIDDVLFESEDLACRFRDAEEMAIFIATIGPHLEEKVDKLIVTGDAGVGCALDMFGTAAVETVAFKTRELIQDYALSQGRRAMTDRYCTGMNCPAYADCGGQVVYWWSPGFGDLETREQQKLFSLLDGSQVGVHLSESCMMLPRKSYTCLLPIGCQAERAPYSCEEGQTEWIRQGSLIKRVKLLSSDERKAHIAPKFLQWEKDNSKRRG